MPHDVTTPLILVALPKLYDPNFFKSVVLLVEHNKDGALGFIINRPSPYPVRNIIENQKYDIPDSVAAWVGGPVGTQSGLVLHARNSIISNAGGKPSTKAEKQSYPNTEGLSESPYIHSAKEQPASAPNAVGQSVPGAESKSVITSVEGASEISSRTSFALSSSEGALEELANYGKLFESIPAEERKEKIPVLYPYRFIVGHAGWGARQLEDEIRQGAWLEVPLDLDLIFNTPWQNLWDKCLSSVGVDPTSLMDSTSSPYLH
ncbi:MAG: YqgE/AlgH family protein [Oligoflexales bacterium]